MEMLGLFQVCTSAETINRFRTRRVGLLLAFLALNRQRMHSREEIAELLWPDEASSTALRNLRQAIHSLRSMIEPEPMPGGSYLNLSPTLIGLNSEQLSTDVDDFESLINEARAAVPEQRPPLIRQAIALYQGELLPGFNELWVLNERFRLEDLYVWAIHLMISEADRAGSADEAIHYLRLALAKEPADERNHVALMKQYLKSNRPSGAIAQYGELKRILADQLNLKPGEDAQRLLRSARQRAGKMVAPVALNRLPVQLTRLFGREAEIEKVADHFAQTRSRLLTIVGPAGTGKTRLSLEAGQVLSAHLGRRIAFVSLADIDDASLIFDKILGSMEIPRRNGASVLDQLREAIGSEPYLLILDNFEHIIEGGAPLVADILRQVPGVLCLVTSRQSLKIEGENEFPLGPLPIPAAGENLANLATVPSLQMFLDRAQAVRPGIKLTAGNAAALASICKKLEGIPLAIEIAAGLSNSTTPAQMVKYLDQRLATLTSRRSDISPRHRSLRAAIDYGYSLLSESQRRTFIALSVFRGGFTHESAAAVCGFSGGDEVLFQLAERSFLQIDDREPDDSPRHFRMLETFREYGEETLSEGERAALKLAHANYYLAGSLNSQSSPSAEERADIHQRIESDYDNYLAALDFLLQSRQIQDCIRLLATLATVWDIRGTKQIEQDAIRQIARLPEFDLVAAPERIQLFRMLGTTYLRDGEFELAFLACQDALGVALTLAEPEPIASAYYGMALCAGYMGQSQRCLDLCQKVLEFAPVSAGVLLERTYVSIGSAQWSQDEFVAAEDAFVKARQISISFRGSHPDGLIPAHLAGLYLDQGRLDDALAAATEGLRISQETRNVISWVASLSQISRYHRVKGNFPAALEGSREALQMSRGIAIPVLCQELIRNHALILEKLGEDGVATTLLAATRGLESVSKRVDQREVASALESIRVRRTPAQFDADWTAGLGLDLEASFDLALPDE